MEDSILVDAMYGVTFHEWKINGNYHIGEEIDETYEMFKTNGMMRLSYAEAVDAMVKAVQAKIPRGAPMTYVAKPLFTMAMAYVKLVPSFDARQVMGEIYKGLSKFFTVKPMP